MTVLLSNAKDLDEETLVEVSLCSGDYFFSFLFFFSGDRGYRGKMRVRKRSLRELIGQKLV